MKTPLLAFAALFALVLAAAQGATQPNILLIYTDDAGYADFGFQGGGIAGDFATLTPNIDSIASGGIRFTNAYMSAAVCGPSRAGLLTGRNQGRFGFENNIQGIANTGLATTQDTIADTLGAGGYRTYMLGKWHLGQDLPEHHPNQRGFDEFYGFLSGARTFYEFTGANDANKLQRNGTFLAESPGQYLTDMFGNEAAAYIDDHALNHPGTPFFMYIAFNAVHTPLEADPSDLADPRIASITPIERKTLAAMTIATDDAVGSVLSRLAANGMTNDTLIVFTNDNGGPEDNLSLFAPNWSDNGPLRGNKTQLYEGGIRVPFAVKWPACVPAALEGTDMHDPVVSLDLLPTFAAAAGSGLLPGQETDGIDLLPRITGASATPLQRCLFWRTSGSEGGQSAVRQGDWKLYRVNTTGVTELYNLSSDLSETTDLAAAMPEKVAELEARFADFERDLIEPLWGGAAMTISTPDLSVSHADIGLELSKSTSGNGHAYDDRRIPLSLDEDWSLEFSIERFNAGTGLTRQAFITLGGDGTIGSFVRIGAFFNIGGLEIRELGTGANTNITGLTFPAVAGVHDFRVSYDAATKSISLTWEGNTVTHALSATWLGSYTEFTHTGYTINDTVARFSPVNFYIDRLAPNTSPTWSRMKIARDYTPGTTDPMDNFMGGTEAISLTTHKGKLYAGIGYWNDVFFGTGSPDPHPGPQVLVKETHDGPWKQDFAGGSSFLRIENLSSMTFTTDKNGIPLDPPVNLLLAGSGELPLPYGAALRRPVVWIRNDATGAWTPTYPGTPLAGSRTTRTLVDHVDSVTGIHHIFVGFGASAGSSFVRGGYNATTGLIDWEVATPEINATERMLSAGVLNGVLYACFGSNGIDGDDVGGVFWREDGPSPQWHLVYEWPVNAKNPDIRGFTAVPHPKGFDYEVALVTLESFGKVYCIDPIGGDPRNGHEVDTELEIQEFLGDQWNSGVSIGFPSLSAYNDMPEIPHPATGEPVNFIGVAVGHPDGFGTENGNSTYYLVRHRDAEYEWGRIFDPAEPLPNNDGNENGLRATRGIRLSPFPEDRGRVLYFCGFDAGSQTGPVYHNTSWIYRAELPDEQSALDLGGPNIVISIDTAHGWQYQLEESTTLDFDPAGPPFPGDNTVQPTEVLGADPLKDFFRFNIYR